MATRGLAASGALLAACGVALSAYAAHAADGAGRVSLQSAALFALVHGAALAALAARGGRLARMGLALLLLGTLLFSGSLVAAHLLGASTRLAPLGGGLMIVAWLTCAVALLRR